MGVCAEARHRQAHECGPQYGPGRVSAKMPVHNGQDVGRRLQGKRCAPDGREEETDAERAGRAIRLGRRHQARRVADSRARQRHVTVLCQRHACGEHHVDQWQQRDDRDCRVRIGRSWIAVRFLRENDHQRRDQEDDCGLRASSDQAGLKEQKSFPDPHVGAMLWAVRSSRERRPCRIAVGGGGQPGI